MSEWESNNPDFSGGFDTLFQKENKKKRAQPFNKGFCQQFGL